MECDTCGYAISYWDAGGLRAFATNKKKYLVIVQPAKSLNFSMWYGEYKRHLRNIEPYNNSSMKMCRQEKK